MDAIEMIKEKEVFVNLKINIQLQNQIAGKYLTQV